MVKIADDSALCGVRSWWRRSVVSAALLAEQGYQFELRHGRDVVATGRFSRSEALEVGDVLEISGVCAVIRLIEPLLGEAVLRLVAEQIAEVED